MTIPNILYLIEFLITNTTRVENPAKNQRCPVSTENPEASVQRVGGDQSRGIKNLKRKPWQVIYQRGAKS